MHWNIFQVCDEESPGSNIQHQQTQKENTVGKGPKKIILFCTCLWTLSVKQENILTGKKEEERTWERKRKSDRLGQRNTASQL